MVCLRIRRPPRLVQIYAFGCIPIVLAPSLLEAGDRIPSPVRSSYKLPHACTRTMPGRWNQRAVKT